MCETSVSKRAVRPVRPVTRSGRGRIRGASRRWGSDNEEHVDPKRHHRRLRRPHGAHDRFRRLHRVFQLVFFGAERIREAGARYERGHLREDRFLSRGAALDERCPSGRDRKRRRRPQRRRRAGAVLRRGASRAAGERLQLQLRLGGRRILRRAAQREQRRRDHAERRADGRRVLVLLPERRHDRGERRRPRGEVRPAHARLVPGREGDGKAGLLPDLPALHHAGPRAVRRIPHPQPRRKLPGRSRNPHHAFEDQRLPEGDRGDGRRLCGHRGAGDRGACREFIGNAEFRCFGRRRIPATNDP